MPICHDARTGRYIGSHWPNHVRASALLDHFLLELVGATEGSHKPRSAKRAFLLPNRFTFLPALLARRVRGEGVGNPHIKGQPTLQFDLPIKQVNGFRSSQPQLCQNVLHLALEARLDARANRCGFSHGAIVALV